MGSTRIGGESLPFPLLLLRSAKSPNGNSDGSLDILSGRFMNIILWMSFGNAMVFDHYKLSIYNLLKGIKSKKVPNPA
jgi:hypothetical protein